jgi:hypothetical protein
MTLFGAIKLEHNGEEYVATSPQLPQEGYGSTREIAIVRLFVGRGVAVVIVEDET